MPPRTDWRVTDKARMELRPREYARALKRGTYLQALGAERRISNELHLFNHGHVPVWRHGPGVRYCNECGLVEVRP